MTKAQNPDDPRGLIAEAYRIEGIDTAQCRTIFLDWSLDTRITEPVASAERLARAFRTTHPEHPMTAVLAEAGEATVKGRRGGRRGRQR